MPWLRAARPPCAVLGAYNTTGRSYIDAFHDRLVFHRGRPGPRALICLQCGARVVQAMPLFLRQLRAPLLYHGEIDCSSRRTTSGAESRACRSDWLVMVAPPAIQQDCALALFN
jgi:hypothetical protein